MNIEDILDNLEEAEKAHKRARIGYEECRKWRAELIQQAIEAGVPQAVIGRLLGVSRQRIHQLMEV